MFSALLHADIAGWPHAASGLPPPSQQIREMNMDDAITPQAPIREWTTRRGMRVFCYALPLEQIPADFFADPDGSWTYDSLAEAAGFSDKRDVAIGALRLPFNGHPDGAAVVTLNSESRPYVAIVECPIAYACVEEAEQVSAA